MAHEAALPTIVADSLALAVVVSSDAPTLLLDGDLTVIAGSASFSRAFQVDFEALKGQSVFSLGAGEWDVPQLRSLLRLTLSGDPGLDAYEMDLRRPGLATRRLVITAHVLDYADPTSVRVLLAASDVTEARIAAKLKDDLLHEKAILHQELQHRVANSLQIIASVLLTWHNLIFYQDLIAALRTAIAQGAVRAFADRFVARYQSAKQMKSLE